MNVERCVELARTEGAVFLDVRQLPVYERRRLGIGLRVGRVSATVLGYQPPVFGIGEGVVWCKVVCFEPDGTVRDRSVWVDPSVLLEWSERSAVA